ncbi:DoxX family protein [Aquabacterium sp. A3]|uniref:DoxX family protein n=1 Tax=Aquabacterium sp. A3 TaxID=3132829 RepID=UPI0031198A4D
MSSLLSSLERALEHLSGLGLLGLRLWLGQEFVMAGWRKLSGGLSAPEWFAGLDFPFPVSLLPVDANWLAAGAGEIALGTLLAVGLLSRLSGLGLMFITWVAVYTVHFDLGWAGWNQIDSDEGQGFKVPLIMGLMLLTIVTQGGGRLSLDAWLRRR